MQEEEISAVFPIVKADHFSNLSISSFNLDNLRNPIPNTLEAVAARYVLPALSAPGRYTKSKIESNLIDAARGINRTSGIRWSEGAIALIAPIAAARISKIFRKKTERVAATYLSVLSVPIAYEKFVEKTGVQGTIKKRDLEMANKFDHKCGVFPFC